MLLYPLPDQSLLSRVQFRRLAGGAALLALFFDAAVASAQFSQLNTSSTRNAMRVHTEWSPVTLPGGYYPIHVELTSTNGQRELRIVFRRRGGNAEVEASQTVIVPPNAPTRVTLLVPMTLASYWGELRVYEGNQELLDLRQSGFASGFVMGRGEPPTAILLSRVAPDWRIFNQSLASMFGSQASEVGHLVLAPDRAPERWIEYSGYDVLLISLADLEGLARERRDPIIAWVMTGGNLVVWGVTNDSERERLDRVLDLATRPPAGASWTLGHIADRRIVKGIDPTNTTSSTWTAVAHQKLKEGLEPYREYCTGLMREFGDLSFSDSDRNNLAWACVLGPGAVPEPNRVVNLVQRAVANNSRNAAYLNTFGAALYRAGRYEEAVAKLTMSMSLGNRGGIPEDWVFLAMSYYKLGDEARAKEYLDRVARRAANERNADWLVIFKEAEEVLSGKDPAPNKTNGNVPQGEPAAGGSEAIASRPCGLGKVVRLTAANAFPGSDVDWGWLFNTIGTQRMRWSERYGVAPAGDNPDYWNFLIAGVGRAPVGAFQILITIFAIVIGPVNYFFFRRRRRLYLLPLTVPALALVTSGTLFGYSLAFDGFGIRTRVRSITMLDQTRGEGVSLSRISYYAGLSPAGGLKFSIDTAVIPIYAESDPPIFSAVDWTDQQHLETGWLRSRTLTQFLTSSYRPMSEQLVIAKGSSSDLRVTNNLGTAIHYLAVCDADGTAYFAQDLPVGARAQAQPQQVSVTHEAVRQRILAQNLDMPQEIQDSQSWRMFPWSSRRFWGNRMTASWSTNILEQALREFTATAAPAAYFQPRTYIAITDRPFSIELGVPDTQDTDSLYVLLGSF